ncbi:MAG: methylmalonyl-CoA epimerase [Deltaproteobacteria bacterium]|nr:methylmalonyl-CoA epimerase [Deltaproteobacteria bacterium]
MKVLRLAHVAVAVSDLEAAGAAFAALGLQAQAPELVAAQRTRAALVPIGAGNVELIAPAGNEGLQRFLDRRGAGLHHLCLEVDDLVAALAELKGKGLRLIDEAPRPGAHGYQVAFLHPASCGGVLIELCEAAPASPAGAAPSAK